MAASWRLRRAGGGGELHGGEELEQGKEAREQKGEWRVSCRQDRIFQ
jgi:hypothetical protein